MDHEEIKTAIGILQRFCEEAENLPPETEPSLRTPVGIKFMVNLDGQVIGLCFNDDKQVLGYSQAGVYTVYPVCTYVGSPVEGLPLTECKYEDLRPGMFVLGLGRGITLEDRTGEHDLYNMITPGCNRVYIAGGVRPVPGELFASWSFWKIGK